jgi:cytochrome P450
MDVIADLAVPLSLGEIETVVGVPSADHERFYAWANALGAAVESTPNPAALALASRGLRAASNYLHALLAQRKESPADDLLSALIGADPNDAPLGEEEIIGLNLLLLLAGHETATHLIANGLLALLEHPDQVERLHHNLGLWPTALQELLRYASPLHGVLRTATEDLVLSGKLIRQGERVVICLAAANRDPEMFRDPEQLDVGRTPNPHLAFGRGIHFCVGASLAELIADTAIRGMFQRFPRLRLASPNVQWQGNYLFRRLRTLRVLF